MDLEIEAFSARFDPLDDRWLGQVAQLAAEFRSEVGRVGRRSAPEPGSKGTEVGPIVVALGSAGVFAAVVEVIKAFLSRDRTRSIKLSWHEDGEMASFEIQGPEIDEAVVRRVLTELGRTTEPRG